MSDEQIHKLQNGLEAERIICNYYASLISYINPVGKKCWQKRLIHPSKKIFDKVMRHLLQDYIDTVNIAQRHIKYNSTYCL